MPGTPLTSTIAPASTDERAQLESIVGEPWLSVSLATVARNHSMAEMAGPHFAEIKRVTDERVARVRAAVEKRLAGQIAYWDQRAEELKALELKGKKPRINSGRARGRGLTTSKHGWSPAVANSTWKPIWSMSRPLWWARRWLSPRDCSIPSPGSRRRRSASRGKHDPGHQRTAHSICSCASARPSSGRPPHARVGWLSPVPKRALPHLLRLLAQVSCQSRLSDSRRFLLRLERPRAISPAR